MGKVTIKIYNMDGVDWWAGATSKEVLEAYTKHWAGEGYDGELNLEPEELSADEASRLIYYDDIYNQADSPKRSFAEQLQKKISENAAFPCFFASSDY